MGHPRLVCLAASDEKGFMTTSPEGKDVLDGLEVRVAFGGHWKESLSELSGGQRSLVALSLILALLLFKPAPLYILDEVDAALDLSHTQNIGHMLKTHFQHSQVILLPPVPATAGFEPSKLGLFS